MEGEDYWTAIEPFWEEVSIYDGPDVFLDQLGKVPPHLATLLCGHWCQSEVYNGGFHQFFHNSTGVLAPEAVDAYRAIGMPELGGVVARAMSVFGPEYPRQREVRQKFLDGRSPDSEAWDDDFGALESEFFRLLQEESGGWDTAADRWAASRQTGREAGSGESDE